MSESREIRLLGVPSVQTEGRTVSAFRSNRIPALLGLLSTKPGPWPRETVAAALWPDHMPAEGRHNLRQTLLYTRQLLGEDVIRGERQTLELAQETDVTILLQTTERQTPDAAERAVAIYRGEFLEGLEDEWIVPVRERCARVFVNALLLLAKSVMQDAPARALEYAERAAKAEPFLDSARAAKIQALRTLGEDAAAHREFTAYKQLLADELGIEPSPLVSDVLSAAKAEKEPADTAQDAIHFLLSGTRPRQGLDLAVARVPYWIAKGQYEEGSRLLRHALEVNARAAGSVAHQRAQVALAELESAAGNPLEAGEALAQALPHLKDPVARARALILQARHGMSAYQSQDAAAFLAQILELAGPEERMDALRCAAEMAFQQEDLIQAEKHAQACVDLAQSLGDWDTFTNSICLLAITRFRGGRPQEALAAARQALDELSDKDSSRGVSFTRVRIFRLLEEMGDWREAEAGYRRGIDEARRLNDSFGLAIVLTYLGDLLTAEGRYAEALLLHQEALRLRRKAKEKLGEATSLRGIGRIYLAQNKLEEARAALRESARLFEPEAGRASVLYELACVSKQAGDREMAVRIATQALHMLRGMSRLTLLTIGPSGDSLVAKTEQLLKDLS